MCVYICEGVLPCLGALPPVEIKTCTKNNSFELSGDICKQIHGVSMESPLSPVLANLYMEYSESEILSFMNTNPLLLLGYVDDIFIVWPNGQDFDTFFPTMYMMPLLP